MSASEAIGSAPASSSSVYYVCDGRGLHCPIIGYKGLKVRASVHLALFVPDLSGGGAERVMLNLAHGFADRGLSVDLVLSSARGEYLERVHDNVSIHDLGVKRAINSVAPLVHYLRHNQPDALISGLSQTNIAALVAARLSTTRVPVLVTEHQSFDAERERGFRRSLFPRLARRLYPYGKVVAVSAGVADSLAAYTGIDRNSITVINNPVLTREFERAAEEPLPEDTARPYLLGMGRLTAQKNFPLLLEAFAKFRESRPGYRLLILGEGPDRPRLEATIAELGLTADVSLPGFTANPFPYVREASAFVMSSDWEGLPTVLIEALALDVPVVSTDCDSGPREILNDGRLGELVPVGDAVALAAAMVRAVENEGNRARPGDLDRYTVPSAVSAYLRALDLDG